MNSQPVNDKFDKLKGQIKKAWDKLSDEEIMTYQNEPEKFFISVKDKYGTSQEDTEKQIKKFGADGHHIPTINV